MTGLPEDPSDRLTGKYSILGSPQQVLDRDPEDSGAAAADLAPAPWYRNRVLLALWALTVALLLTLVIYGIVELSRGGGGGAGGSATSTTSSTSSSTPDRSSTTSPSTTTETTPPPEEPGQTTQDLPPPANTSAAPAPAQPPRHHHPHIPSTITLPHTVITLPHGF